MHEFDRATSADDVERGWGSGGIKGGGCSHGEPWAHALAAGLDQMARDIGEEIAVGANDAQEFLLGSSEILHHGRQDRERVPHRE